MKGVKEKLFEGDFEVGRKAWDLENVGVRIKVCLLLRFGLGFSLRMGSNGGIITSGFTFWWELFGSSTTFPVISNETNLYDELRSKWFWNPTKAKFLNKVFHRQKILNQSLSNTTFKTEQIFLENTVRDSEFRKQQKHTEAEKFWSKNVYFSLTES